MLASVWQPQRDLGTSPTRRESPQLPRGEPLVPHSLGSRSTVIMSHAAPQLF